VKYKIDSEELASKWRRGW